MLWLFLTLVPSVRSALALPTIFYPSFVQTVQSLSANTIFIQTFILVCHCLRNQMFSMQSHDAHSTTAIDSALTYTALPLLPPTQTAISLFSQSQSLMSPTFPILIRFLPGIGIQCHTSVSRPPLSHKMSRCRRMRKLAHCLRKFPQSELGIQSRKPLGYLQVQ